MRKSTAASVAALLLITPVAQANDKEKCAVLAPPIGQASQSFSKMFVAMQGLDYAKISTEFTGEERAQMEKMGEVQARLLPVFEEYLFELETLGLMMSRCSR